MGWWSSGVVFVVGVGGPPCDGRWVPAEDSQIGHKHTMALDRQALLDLLGELTLTDVPDRIRSATERLSQELIVSR